eukprot:TRINITY_DN2885_c0_g1_i1.p1 TRINITY_DN2885_c0_g1~~TRINITY_DN2885_c0_g1_i1.p1  ORF type:complete len:255 (+),score=113.05 TRINITY_DN2885_c0_g1_i1:59-823(+)
MMLRALTTCSLRTGQAGQLSMMGMGQRAFMGMGNTTRTGLDVVRERPLIHDYIRPSKREPPPYWRRVKGGFHHPPQNEVDYPVMRPGVCGDPHGKSKPGKRAKKLKYYIQLNPIQKDYPKIMKILKDLGQEDFLDMTLVGKQLPEFPHHVLYPRVTEEFFRRQKQLPPLPEEELEVAELKRDRLFFDYCVSKGVEVPSLEEVTALRKKGILLQVDMENRCILRISSSKLTTELDTSTLSPEEMDRLEAPAPGSL